MEGIYPCALLPLVACITAAKPARAQRGFPGVAVQLQAGPAHTPTPPGLAEDRGCWSKSGTCLNLRPSLQEVLENTCTAPPWDPTHILENAACLPLLLVPCSWLPGLAFPKRKLCQEGWLGLGISLAPQEVGYHVCCCQLTVSPKYLLSAGCWMGTLCF